MIRDRMEAILEAIEPRVSVKKSTIPGAGKGAFCACDLPPETVLRDHSRSVIQKVGSPGWDSDSAIKHGKDTVRVFPDETWAKFINHSRTPNLKLSMKDFELRTLRRVKKGEELTLDYRTFVHPKSSDYRKAVTDSWS